MRSTPPLTAVLLILALATVVLAVAAEDPRDAATRVGAFELAGQANVNVCRGDTRRETACIWMFGFLARRHKECFISSGKERLHRAFSPGRKILAYGSTNLLLDQCLDLGRIQIPLLSLNLNPQLKKHINYNFGV